LPVKIMTDIIVNDEGQYLINGFISYSHDDRKICNELRKPLKQLTRVFPIDEFWIDEANTTGRCFRTGYQGAVDAASIHILMISANSLWSDEIMDREIPYIFDKQEKDDDLVFPVIVEDCLWEPVVGTVLPSPRDKSLRVKPLKNWGRLSQGINQTARELQHAISHHFGYEPKRLFNWRQR